MAKIVNTNTILVIILIFSLSILLMGCYTVSQLPQHNSILDDRFNPTLSVPSFHGWEEEREDSASSSTSATPYDIVTLVHHSDMAPFISYGLRSWLIYLEDLAPNANIFIICNPEAYDAVNFHLTQEEASGHQSTQKIVPILQSIYPFSLESTTHENTWTSKPTWVYQQLLKLYSYQVLSKQHGIDPKNIPKIKDWFTIIDSDTIFVKSISLFDPYPIYNVATDDTGAFINDINLGTQLVKEVFPKTKIRKAFRDCNGRKFTTITHWMTFHGRWLDEMLNTIEKLHKKSAYKGLCKLKSSVLSEWELYLAWIMNYRQYTFHVRQIPYINWGMLDHKNLVELNNETLSDIIYLSKHDDYSIDTKCCVNSKWSKIFGGHNCQCCQKNDCSRLTINCHTLGSNKGCKVVDESNGIVTMEFNML